MQILSPLLTLSLIRCRSCKPWTRDQLCVDFLVDFSSVEIFVQRGYGALTHNIFPNRDADNLGLEFAVLSGKVAVTSMGCLAYGRGKYQDENGSGVRNS